MQKIVVWIIFMALFSINGFGQSSSANESKIKAYRKLFARYEYSNVDSGLMILKNALNEFTTLHYKPGIAAVHEMFGSAYNAVGELDSARSHFQRSLVLHKDLGIQRGIALANNGLGVIEGKTSHYPEAARHFLNALKIFERISDTDGIASSYIKLGMISDLTKNYRKAIEYYKNGLALGKGGVSKENVIYLNNNIGGVYLKIDSPSLGLPHFEAALRLSDRPELSRIRILPLINIGNIKAEQGKYREALQSYTEANEIAMRENMHTEQVRLLINISRLLEDRDPDSVTDMLAKAELIAVEIGDKSLLAEVYDARVMHFRHLGNYQGASDLQLKLSALIDTLYDLEREGSITRMQAQHELETADRKVASLQAQEMRSRVIKTVFFIIGFISLALAAGLFLANRNSRKLNVALRKSKIELEKANSTKDRLFSVIGHDLKGPMNNIPVLLGFYHDAPEEERQFIIDAIEESAINSSNTLDTLLNWGKSQIKGLTYNPTTFKLTNIVDNKINFLRLAAAGKNITIINTVPGYIAVHADIDQVRFIVRNLLSNAVKFTRSNGLVEIGATVNPTERTVTCSIKDSGIGIEPDRLTTIFEPISESTTGTASEVGNGLGLMLVKEFVMVNKGTIWVESKKNEGAIFSFTLPLSSEIT